MRLPRDVSGLELVAGLEKVFGYRKVHQEGSHVILQVDSPHRHRIAVPAHKVLRLGTLNAILRAVAQAQGVRKEEAARQIFG